MTQDKKDIKVRRMEESDLPKVNYVDNLLSGLQRSPTWPFSFESYWRVYSPELGFVAEIDGNLVGFLSGHIRQEHNRSIFDETYGLRRSPRSERVGWMDMIGIRPDYQKQGVGRALVEAFLAECQRNKIPVSAYVRDSDEELKKFLSSVGLKKWDMAIFEKSS